MIHLSEEGWALDVDHYDRLGDHPAHSSCTDLVGHHALHASGAIWGYELTGQYSLPLTCYESCSATATQPARSKSLICIKPLPASDWEG